MASRLGLMDVLRNIDEVKRTLPIEIANLTQNYFVNAFRLQSWNGTAWQQVQRRIEGTPEYKYPKTKKLSRRTKPILIGTGRLRREVANSIRVISWPTVRLVISAPYAEYINEGTEHMVARTFADHTEELERKQLELIEKRFSAVWPA